MNNCPWCKTELTIYGACYNKACILWTLPSEAFGVSLKDLRDPNKWGVVDLKVPKHFMKSRNPREVTYAMTVLSKTFIERFLAAS